MIPEPLKRTSHGFPKRANGFLHMHNIFLILNPKKYPDCVLVHTQYSGQIFLLCHQQLTQMHNISETTGMGTCNKDSCTPFAVESTTAMRSAWLTWPSCRNMCRTRVFQTGGYAAFFSVCLYCFGLRIVFHYGPAYPMENASALPSPQFEMLSITNSGRTSFAGIRECKTNRRRKFRRRSHSPRLKCSPGSVLG